MITQRADEEVAALADLRLRREFALEATRHERSRLPNTAGAPRRARRARGGRALAERPRARATFFRVLDILSHKLHRTTLHHNPRRPVLDLRCQLVPPHLEFTSCLHHLY